jgi:hypothetical protein
VAIREIFLSGDGNDAQDGLSWATRVKTFTAARVRAKSVPAVDDVRFVVGQFNMSFNMWKQTGIDFAQRLGTGIDANDVRHGWSMRAHDPALPWHFTDLDVLRAASDFAQVHKNGTTYNANTVGCPNIANNNGTPVGQPTGIWVTRRDVADPDKPFYRVARVWRGGNPLTINDPNAFPSACDPYNEIWEAASFATMGLDETHMWTQLTPGEVWPEDAPAPPQPVPAPDGGRLFVFSPQGNPADKWGGVTVLTQWSRGASIGEFGLLTIQNSEGWHVDESVKAIGGGIGAFKLRGNCTNGRFEARVDATSPFHPVLDLRAIGTQNTFTAIEVSPRWDLRVTGKPYYEIDDVHNTGQSDALRMAGNSQIRGLLVRGRTSTSGQLCYIRDPGHSAIGRPNPGAGMILDGLVVERDFSVYIGGMQYQRAFGINGDKTNVLNCTISGRVYGQRTPSQIDGNVRIVGAEFHYGQQIIPAAPDNTPTYPGRFNSDVREWSNLHPDGKNRDCAGLVLGLKGAVEVRDCVFNAVHGPALRVGAAHTLGDGDSCLVENCTFINGAVPGSQQTAVLVDVRGGAPGKTRLRNNGAVGYGPGGQYTTSGFNRFTVRVEDLHTALPVDQRVLENVGWQRLAFAMCFG